MGVPDYIAGLRKHVGHELVYVPSVSAVIVDEGRILLGKRSDDGRWSLISGFVDPGEQPATAVVREVAEETGVTVAPQRLTSVVSHTHRYPNGDLCEILNLAWRCRLLAGVARVNDDESEAVEWFPLERLPDLDTLDRLIIEHALPEEGPTWFVPAEAGSDGGRDAADIRRTGSGFAARIR
ncbi:NUDIX hydrolase [Micromonospora sp. SH-82]|uniref:NUDIX hydrolase n=1 Tax=Micromonospora sp. SH-82 TaxID=3132938 RepID=UPI003EB91598